MSAEVFFAQKAFILHEGKLLAIQKAPTCPYYPGYWEVPGGRMDYGESADDHIRREVREEVGIEIEPGMPFHIWDWRIDGAEPGPQVVAVARLARPLSFDITLSGQIESDHIGDIRWVAVDDLAAYRWIPNFSAAMDRFLAYHAASDPA